ncbi:uncharacterized protein [Montipora capricornis]|uniref:uncharacterized protein n=1 Tax=Montipora capricornis TaxID=246305 RepID=UPI0035F20A5C
MDFTKQVANQEIAEDEVMVSFDVVSLFTAIPVDKACDYIRKKLDEDTTLHLRTKLNTDEIISLLEFTLSNNYFMFNDTVYKQIHGCAMGSPVSPVVANLCMEIIEESAIASSTTPPKVRKRYVDDSFVIIKEHSVRRCHSHQQPSILVSNKKPRQIELIFHYKQPWFFGRLNDCTFTTHKPLCWNRRTHARVSMGTAVRSHKRGSTQRVPGIEVKRSETFCGHL